MELYLIKILQTNELEDLQNQKIVDLLKKHNGGVYMLGYEEAEKYLTCFVFEKQEEREAFADAIPEIAFEFDSIEYPDKIIEKIKNGEKIETKPKNYKPNYVELKIESFLEKRDIEFQKHYNDTIDYEVSLSTGKQALIVVDYKMRFLTGGIYGGSVIACNEKKLIKGALADLLKNIEEENNKNIVVS